MLVKKTNNQVSTLRRFLSNALLGLHSLADGIALEKELVGILGRQSLLRQIVDLTLRELVEFADAIKVLAGIQLHGELEHFDGFPELLLANQNIRHVMS